MADKISSTLAREGDGTIQITLTLPAALVQKTEGEALAEIGRDLEVSGFRKGKAPLSKVKALTPRESLIKRILGKVLGKAIGDATTTHKIKPALYPRIEVLKAGEGEDWEVRATTCELPKINLGNYQDVIKGLGKAKKETSKELSREEKEQLVIKTLLETVKFTIPKILIEEEIEDRLAQLLDKIEKLGLSLEGYLGSLGKTVEQLRAQYQEQAKNTIALELILEAIAQGQKVVISEKQVDEVINAAQADPSLKNKLDNPQQRKVIASVLRRRTSLDSLVKLM